MSSDRIKFYYIRYIYGRFKLYLSYLPYAFMVKEHKSDMHLGVKYITQMRGHNKRISKAWRSLSPTFSLFLSPPFFFIFFLLYYNFKNLNNINIPYLSYNFLLQMALSLSY